MATIDKSRLAAIIAAARAKKQAEQGGADGFTDTLETLQPKPTIIPEQSIESLRKAEFLHTTDKYGNSITYNDRQGQFISLASSGVSCILIGPAGTGKTTCMKGTVNSLIQSSLTPILNNHDHKHLPQGVPGIVVCAYTRRATNNIRRNMDEGMKANCITIHKLLEYGPVYHEVVTENGDTKTTMAFEPSRGILNPLPPEIKTIIFEESSMIGTELYNQVVSACPHNPQIIFLGDIQQLPPVFGAAILGFKLLELPVVELTEVYRQALESPIIRLAHRILSGQPIQPASLESWNVPDQLKITAWKKKIDAESALSVSEKLFIKLYNAGEYNPESDIILIPFNKSYGTIELNKSIANQIARKSSLVTWEVVAGFVKHYYSVGDKVLYDREDAIILDIFPNPSYTGAAAQTESTYLDYWGHYNKPAGIEDTSQTIKDPSETDIDFILAQVADTNGEDRVTQSSHHIRLRMMDSDTEKTITKAAEVNALILGYALTVHKSQGSEWDKVFLLLHNSHSTMLQRELLYTAVTRAKRELYVICEQDTFTKAIQSQRIKGNTLDEKAEYFKGKLDNRELQS
jgi:exodeoxyribonuclease V alpha subunit